jgi:hypothetical protein
VCAGAAQNDAERPCTERARTGDLCLQCVFLSAALT